MNTKLILRSTTSPFPSPYQDTTKGSVLSHKELDENQIYLKGEVIYTAETGVNLITLKKLNGNDVVISALTEDFYVTGATLESGTTLTLTRNDDANISVDLQSIAEMGSVYNIIPTGQTINVGVNEEYLVYGDLIVEGIFNNSGTTVIINGSLVLSGAGQFNNTNDFLTVDLVRTDDEVYLTGGTISGDTLTLGMRNDPDVVITGMVASDIYITGGTFAQSANTITLTRNDDVEIPISGVSSDNFFVTGMTFNNGNYDLTVTRNDGTSITDSLSILATDMNITGGTYNPANGVGTFSNNSGGTFDVSGFLTGYTDSFVTGGTYTQSANTITLTRNDDVEISVTGITTDNFYVTGGTLTTGNTLNLVRNDGGNVNVDLTALDAGSTIYNYIPSGQTVNVAVNEEYFVYGDLTIGGTLNNSGTTVIVNGALVLSGSGIFNNDPGNYLNVDLVRSAEEKYLTGATISTGGTLTLGMRNDSDISVTGISLTDTNLYTTGSTLVGETIYFDRNDVLSAYTANIDSGVRVLKHNNITISSTNSPAWVDLDSYTVDMGLFKDGDIIEATGYMTLIKNASEDFSYGISFAGTFVGSGTVPTGSYTTTNKVYVKMTITRETATSIFVEEYHEWQSGSSGNNMTLMKRDRAGFVGLPNMDSNNSLLNLSAGVSASSGQIDMNSFNVRHFPLQS